MRYVIRPIALCALLTLTLIPVSAQTADLGAEIEALKKGQAAIQKDVAEIKKMLVAMQPAKPKPFAPLDISLKGAPFQGSADAKVAVVEFTDYQCPFCKRHKTGTLPALTKEYIDTGKIKYIMRQFPLKSIHKQAAKASAAALCAGDQGKYWEVSDKIFANQRKIADADLLGYAEESGVDKTQFTECVESDKYAAQVDKDVAEGMKGGVRGTPSFFLGLTDPNDDTKFRATQFLRGAQPFAAFKRVIDKLLAGKAEKAPTGSD